MTLARSNPHPHPIPLPHPGSLVRNEYPRGRRRGDPEGYCEAALEQSIGPLPPMGEILKLLLRNKLCSLQPNPGRKIRLFNYHHPRVTSHTPVVPCNGHPWRQCDPIVLPRFSQKLACSIKYLIGAEVWATEIRAVNELGVR